MLCILGPLFLIYSTANSEDLSSGIVYGKDHAFIVKAPKGWVLDNEAGAPQGLHAVFYPQGGSWESSPAIMYANTSHKEQTEAKSLAEFIEQDLKNFKEHSPDTKMESMEQLTTKSGKALVRKFSGDSWNNVEEIAYIEESKVFVLLVLSSRTKDDFKKFAPAFKQLVESYKFLGSEIRKDRLKD